MKKIKITKARCQNCGKNIIRPIFLKRLFENSPPIWVDIQGPFCSVKCVRAKLNVVFNRLLGYKLKGPTHWRRLPKHEPVKNHTPKMLEPKTLVKYNEFWNVMSKGVDL